MVLDDIWDENHLKPFIVENAPHGHLSFTTRNAALATAVNATRFELDSLNESMPNYSVPASSTRGSGNTNPHSSRSPETDSRMNVPFGMKTYHYSRILMRLS